MDISNSWIPVIGKCENVGCIKALEEAKLVSGETDNIAPRLVLPDTSAWSRGSGLIPFAQGPRVILR